MIVDTAPSLIPAAARAGRLDLSRCRIGPDAGSTQGAPWQLEFGDDNTSAAAAVGAVRSNLGWSHGHALHASECAPARSDHRFRWAHGAHPGARPPWAAG